MGQGRARGVAEQLARGLRVAIGKGLLGLLDEHGAEHGVLPCPVHDDLMEAARQRRFLPCHGAGLPGWGRAAPGPAVAPSSCPLPASAASRSASNARSPSRRHRVRRWAGSASPAPRSWLATSRSAPSRVARSSSSSSTRSDLRTRPPSSIRCRVRSLRALAQSRVSSRARAASRRLRSTTSRRSLAVVASRSASRFGGTCLAASPLALAVLLKEGLAAFGPPRDGFG